jgi:hypothetical protein
LRHEFEEMQRALNKVAHDLELLNQREQLEREKHLLMLKNALLRMERRLPPPEAKDRS